MKKVLVTGGLGYIGSHACIALFNEGYKPIIIDNLANSSLKVLDIIKTIINVSPSFYLGDIRDEILLKKIFHEHKVYAVLHFAGLKSIEESIDKPKLYRDNNIGGTKKLVKVMQLFDVNRIIFSSSATIYGEPEFIPINEEHSIRPNNPYGECKYEIELLLEDISKETKNWCSFNLRYFNPLGSHKSGLLKDKQGKNASNIMPRIIEAASKKGYILKIFGNTYKTPDGTGIRDYIHINDLVSGHIAAIKKSETFVGIKSINLGTGKGYSVLELIDAFEVTNNISIPYKISDRRKGDIDISIADNSLAKNFLAWSCNYNLHQMCRDSWSL